MTTFNGFVRRTIATIHWLERAAEQYALEAIKQEKLRLKAEQHALAEQAIDTYNEVIASLTVVHKQPVEIIDWKEMLQDPQPTSPAPDGRPEQTHPLSRHTGHAKFRTDRPSGIPKDFKHNIQLTKTTGIKAVPKLDANALITHSRK